MVNVIEIVYSKAIMARGEGYCFHKPPNDKECCYEQSWDALPRLLRKELLHEQLFKNL